jgi:hypothetical protein
MIADTVSPQVFATARIRSSISGDTFPRKCRIQHFLGFTFTCGRSRRGNFQLQRKTRRDRMRRKLRDIKAE